MEHTGPEAEQEKKTSVLAIASLVLGILGIPYQVLFPSGGVSSLAIDTLLLALPCIAAVILGVIAIVRIKKSAALKGLVIAVVGAALGAFMMLPVIMSSITMSFW